MSYKDELMNIRKSMCEVIEERNDFIDRLVGHESNETYPMSPREERQGDFDRYEGISLEDEKEYLLDKISVLTSWIEHQKERFEDAQIGFEIYEERKLRND